MRSTVATRAPCRLARTPLTWARCGLPAGRRLVGAAGLAAPPVTTGAGAEPVPAAGAGTAGAGAGVPVACCLASAVVAAGTLATWAGVETVGTGGETVVTGVETVGGETVVGGTGRAVVGGATVVGGGGTSTVVTGVVTVVPVGSGSPLDSARTAAAQKPASASRPGPTRTRAPLTYIPLWSIVLLPSLCPDGRGFNLTCAPGRTRRAPRPSARAAGDRTRAVQGPSDHARHRRDRGRRPPPGRASGSGASRPGTG